MLCVVICVLVWSVCVCTDLWIGVHWCVLISIGVWWAGSNQLKIKKMSDFNILVFCCFTPEGWCSDVCWCQLMCDEHVHALMVAMVPELVCVCVCESVCIDVWRCKCIDVCRMNSLVCLALHMQVFVCACLFCNGVPWYTEMYCLVSTILWWFAQMHKTCSTNIKNCVLHRWEPRPDIDCLFGVLGYTEMYCLVSTVLYWFAHMHKTFSTNSKNCVLHVK